MYKFDSHGILHPTAAVVPILQFSLWLRGVEEYSLPEASGTKGGHQMCRLKHANDLKRDGQPQYPAFDAIEGQQLDSKITLSITAMLQHFIRRYT